MLGLHVTVLAAVFGLYDCPEFWSVRIGTFAGAHQGAAE